MANIVAQRIMPCLWFDRNAEEAVAFYTSIFERSKVGTITRYGEGYPMPKGTVLTVMFELAGQQFMALNGGPMFKFTEAISLVVNCDGQAEVDRYWDALLAGGGKESQCGWLKDRFGMSWQIVPRVVWELFKDQKRCERVMQVLLPMVKLDVAKLVAAGR